MVEFESKRENTFDNENYYQNKSFITVLFIKLSNINLLIIQIHKVMIYN